MASKFVKINGVDFELCGTCNAVADYANANYNEINDVYGRPSDAKVSIWHEWCNWCYYINGMNSDCNAYECGLHISSHTCMFFSIEGYVKMNNGKMYRLWITYANNRCYEITNV